jgi:RNA polymerase-binding transcription factor DksA
VTAHDATVRRLLLADEQETVRRRAELVQDLADVVAAASDVATDDEHDPEGATIAYERARTAALVGQADEHLADIAAARERLDSGAYGRCEACGRPIGAERLAVRPVVRTCIDCASGRRVR